MKTDVNKESDEMMRKGLSHLYATKKVSEAKRERMKNPETKKAVMEYIFGKSNENPLSDIKAVNED